MENRSQIDAVSCINFTTKLAPFWDGFGSHFGSKLAPNCSKNRFQNSSKKRCHVVEIFGRLLVDFGPKFDPNLRRKRFVMLTYVGFWGHLGAKMAPGAPKRPSGSILDRFGTDVRQFFEQFSGIWDRFLISLVIIFRSISGLFFCWFAG